MIQQIQEYDINRTLLGRNMEVTVVQNLKAYSLISCPIKCRFRYQGNGHEIINRVIIGVGIPIK